MPDDSIVLRKSNERGAADFGWLVSRHTFSFGEYYDPAHMGFRSLRVINQDRVAPGGGFPTHPHRDMEIFSYVLEGALEHRDSLGNGRTLKPGQIQMMSTGRGVSHSEFNPSAKEQTHFLQIWITPNAKGLTPAYTEWHPKPADLDRPKVLVISPDGRDRSAVINQDAYVYRVRLGAGESIDHELVAGRGLWLQVVSGPVLLNDAILQPGDGARTEKPGLYSITAEANAEALLFDLK